MRIEVSVPGIRKERGKLPPPTTLGALRLALPLAGRPLICGELDGPAQCEPVTGTQGGGPVATAPGQRQNEEEHAHRLPSVSHRRPPVAFIWCQTAARCSVPVGCAA